MQRVIKNINSVKCIIYFVYLTFVNTKLRFFLSYNSVPKPSHVQLPINQVFSGEQGTAWNY